MAKDVRIHTDFITLGQFLKIVDLVNSGGEVKIFLLTETVYVNGEKDNRRGRKLYKNDVIKVFDKEFKIC